MEMTTTQRVDVERLTELLAKATPGTFVAHQRGDKSVYVSVGDHRIGPHAQGEVYLPYDDAAAMAAAVNALPALLQQLAERDAEIALLNRDVAEAREVFRQEYARAEAAERAREGAEQDRWRTDWPEMTPVSNAHPSIWQSERVIVSLVGGRVTHDVAESFEGQRPLWFIHRDKVRAWQPFPAAFLAANGDENNG